RAVPTLFRRHGSACAPRGRSTSRSGRTTALFAVVRPPATPRRRRAPLEGGSATGVNQIKRPGGGLDQRCGADESCAVGRAIPQGSPPPRFFSLLLPPVATTLVGGWPGEKGRVAGGIWGEEQVEKQPCRQHAL